MPNFFLKISAKSAFTFCVILLTILQTNKSKKRHRSRELAVSEGNKIFSDHLVKENENRLIFDKVTAKAYECTKH